VTGPVAPFPVFDIGHDNGGRGWLGKVGIGGDYQFAGPMGSWVIGAFADAQFSDIKGNYSFNCPGGCLGPTGYAGQLKNDWSWAVGGRIGYVALPGLLTYFNGGYTQANFKQVNYVDAANGGLAGGLVLPGTRRDGWFLGGGTEYAISQIPGLFWKSEYRFADYGTDRLALFNRTNGVPTGVNIDSHKYTHTVRSELVWRFNFGGPVVARY
jgi:outer membrane immunogenic protein